MGDWTNDGQANRSSVYRSCGVDLENLQEDGIQIAGELVELIMETERELLIHGGTADAIAAALETEFEKRGVQANPGKLDKRLIKAILDWEDDFLGFAGIPRAES